MRTNVREALDALFDGRDCRKSHSVYTEQDGARCPECSANHPTTFSYGRHFPLVILTRVSALVNTTKYSATTSTQQSGAREYLTRQGFRPNGNTVENYAVWTKD